LTIDRRPEDKWLITKAQAKPNGRDVRELAGILASADDERPVQAYLKKHPWLLVNHLAGGHAQWVVPKPSLGGKYWPDFLIGWADSLGNHWQAVELESPGKKMLTKKGELSGITNHAIDQISRWRDWLWRNGDSARRSPVEQGLGLYGIDPAQLPGLILVGRRDPSAEGRAPRRGHIQDAIHSYDWLLDEVRARQFHLALRLHDRVETLGQNDPMARYLSEWADELERDFSE
jgi:hypothetical protein